MSKLPGDPDYELGEDRAEQDNEDLEEDLEEEPEEDGQDLLCSWFLIPITPANNYFGAHEKIKKLQVVACEEFEEALRWLEIRMYDPAVSKSFLTTVEQVWAVVRRKNYRMLWRQTASSYFLQRWAIIFYSSI
jgi:hypothetical protein